MPRRSSGLRQGRRGFTWSAWLCSRMALWRAVGRRNALKLRARRQAMTANGRLGKKKVAPRPRWLVAPARLWAFPAAEQRRVEAPARCSLAHPPASEAPTVTAATWRRVAAPARWCRAPDRAGPGWGRCGCRQILTRSGAFDGRTAKECPTSGTGQQTKRGGPWCRRRPCRGNLPGHRLAGDIRLRVAKTRARPRASIPIGRVPVLGGQHTCSLRGR